MTKTLLVVLPIPGFPDSYAQFEKKYTEYKVVHINTKETGEVTPDTWRKANIIITLGKFPESIEQVPNLEWIHLYSAGINQVLQSPLYKSDKVTWTSGNGVHATQISEWILTSMLAHYHQLPTMLEWQRERKWRDNDYKPKGEIFGKRVGILGYGAIGRQTARLAKGHGMDVVVYTLHEKRTPEQKASDTYTPKHSGDPEGTLPSKWYFGQDQLNEFLSSGLDVLVATLPSTPLTMHMLSKKNFQLMPGAFICNVSRGNIIATDDLIEALNDGTLGGAALDVTDPEPLPSEHPLWKAKNVYITPHISGISDEYMPRTLEIIGTNIERKAAGKKMINLVRKADGY